MNQLVPTFLYICVALSGVSCQTGLSAPADICNTATLFHKAELEPLYPVPADSHDRCFSKELVPHLSSSLAKLKKMALSSNQFHSGVTCGMCIKVGGEIYLVSDRASCIDCAEDLSGTMNPKEAGKEVQLQGVACPVDDNIYAEHRPDPRGYKAFNLKLINTRLPIWQMRFKASSWTDWQDAIPHDFGSWIGEHNKPLDLPIAVAITLVDGSSRQIDIFKNNQPFDTNIQFDKPSDNFLNGVDGGLTKCIGTYAPPSPAPPPSLLTVPTQPVAPAPQSSFVPPPNSMSFGGTWFTALPDQAMTEDDADEACQLLGQEYYLVETRNVPEFSFIVDNFKQQQYFWVGLRNDEPITKGVVRKGDFRWESDGGECIDLFWGQGEPDHDDPVFGTSGDSQMEGTRCATLDTAAGVIRDAYCYAHHLYYPLCEKRPPAVDLCEKKTCDTGHICMESWCDPIDGSCVVPVQAPDGILCDDADPNTSRDVCESGTCKGVRKIADTLFHLHFQNVTTHSLIPDHLHLREFWAKDFNYSNDQLVVIIKDYVPAKTKTPSKTTTQQFSHLVDGDYWEVDVLAHDLDIDVLHGWVSQIFGTTTTSVTSSLSGNQLQTTHLPVGKTLVMPQKMKDQGFVWLAEEVERLLKSPNECVIPPESSTSSSVLRQHATSPEEPVTPSMTKAPLGAIIRWECKPGHYIEAYGGPEYQIRKEASCALGRWDAHPMQCKPGCTFPTAGDHGRIDTSTNQQPVVQPGNSVTYACDPGFVPLDPSSGFTSTCTVTGDWTITIFACTKTTLPADDKCKGLTCTSKDQCHNVGLCNPVTGLCTNPPTKNYVVCDDGNDETDHDQCYSGVCEGEDKKPIPKDKCATVICPLPTNPCDVVGKCNADTGKCQSIKKPVGTACDDSDPTTVHDLCNIQGACEGLHGGCSLSDIESELKAKGAIPTPKLPYYPHDQKLRLKCTWTRKTWAGKDYECKDGTWTKPGLDAKCETTCSPFPYTADQVNGDITMQRTDSHHPDVYLSGDTVKITCNKKNAQYYSSKIQLTTTAQSGLFTCKYGKWSPNPVGAEPQCSAALPSQCLSGTTYLGTYSIMCGKVNNYKGPLSSDVWAPDPDCAAGCDIKGIAYCQRFWGGAISEVEVDPTDSKLFTNGGCSTNYGPYPGHNEFQCCGTPGLPGIPGSGGVNTGGGSGGGTGGGSGGSGSTDQCNRPCVNPSSNVGLDYGQMTSLLQKDVDACGCAKQQFNCYVQMNKTKEADLMCEKHESTCAWDCRTTPGAIIHKCKKPLYPTANGDITPHKMLYKVNDVVSIQCQSPYVRKGGAAKMKCIGGPGGTWAPYLTKENTLPTCVIPNTGGGTSSGSGGVNSSCISVQSSCYNKCSIQKLVMGSSGMCDCTQSSYDCLFKASCLGGADTLACEATKIICPSLACNGKPSPGGVGGSPISFLDDDFNDKKVGGLVFVMIGIAVVVFLVCIGTAIFFFTKAKAASHPPMLPAAAAIPVMYTSPTNPFMTNRGLDGDFSQGQEMTQDYTSYGYEEGWEATQTQPTTTYY